MTGPALREDLADLIPVPPADSPPTVEVTLFVANTDDPDEPFEVASATYPQDVLAGRRIQVAFVPPAASAVDLMTTRPADVSTVIPVIGVAGVDLQPDELGELQFSGIPLTVEGDALVDDGDGYSLPTGPIRAGGDAGGQIVDTHHLALAQHHCTLDGVFELAHVARPTVGVE